AHKHEERYRHKCVVGYDTVDSGWQQIEEEWPEPKVSEHERRARNGHTYGYSDDQQAKKSGDHGDRQELVWRHQYRPLYRMIEWRNMWQAAWIASSPNPSGMKLLSMKR